MTEKESFERGQVVKIINSVLDKVHSRGSTPNENLMRELKALNNIIETSRRDLSAMRASDIQGKHIPDATDELEAIVGATAEATSEIMDACEAIQEAVSNVEEEAAQKVTNAVMNIFEACSFQDITGQRITKVVTTLSEIEDKVAKIMSIMAASHGADTTAPVANDEPIDPMSDEALLNGPQMPGQGVTQEDIDKLLAEFD
jgi:chemotaxis protein CheZ